MLAPPLAVPCGVRRLSVLLWPFFEPAGPSRGPAWFFVGLKNFTTNVHDPVFWRVASNTFVYTGIATLLKTVGGWGWPWP